MSLWFLTFFFKVYTETIEKKLSTKNYLLKINKRHYVAILSKLYMGLKIFYSFHNRAETKFEIFFHKLYWHLTKFQLRSGSTEIVVIDEQ